MKPMIQPKMAGLPFLALVFLISCPSPGQLWWERGADRWYYKDDWKGLAISGGRSGVLKAIEVPGGPDSGWIAVWGSRGYRLFLNGTEVGSSVDEGLIDDHDLSPYLKPEERSVTIRIEGQQVCAEGEIASQDGSRYAFATGEDWADGRGGKVRARKLDLGPSTGAFHRSHNGRLLRYNEEERGKTSIAKALARIQKLEDQGIFLLRRFRPAREIVTFDPESPWRRAERLAAPLLDQAREIIKSRAIPAQKSGRFAEAIGFASTAAVQISAAEAPVLSATDLYRAERETTHLENISALLGKQSPPVREDLAELRSLARSSREAHELGDWGTVQKNLTRIRELAGDIRERLEVASRRASEGRAKLLGNLDEFPEDRFGWLNARQLMGSDPTGWPFTVAPPLSDFIDLAGWWAFRTDPENEGEKRGWIHEKPEDSKTLLAPLPWERQGIQEDNQKAPGAPLGKGTTGTDKPYNGFAWYWKNVSVPAAWRGKDLMISVGVTENWGRVFWNGKPIGEVRGPRVEDRRYRQADRLEIPRDIIRFGEENRMAIQVYNHDNFGGIVRGPLTLFLKGREPELRETPGPLSIIQEYTYPVTPGRLHCTFLAGALSPAVIAASEGGVLELRGWEGKGYTTPEVVRFLAPGGSRTVRLPENGTVSISGEDLSESWILLRGGSTNALIVPVQRPRGLTWKKTHLGTVGLEIDFGDFPALAVILCLPADEKMDAAACRFWERALRKYPVAASERVEAAGGSPDLQIQQIRYTYLDLPGSPEDPIPPAAPVPMLASFGLEHDYPGLKVEGATPTEYRSSHATYMVVKGTDTVIYKAPPVDRSKVMKGFGELFARSRVEDNIHGGLGEVEMFQRAAEWGFDHCRYAIAFNADWDLPLVKFMGGPLIENNEERWKRLDRLVENCNEAGIQMMLCSFSEIRSRRWLAHPEEEKNCFELWRQFAKRYAHLPDWAISYDFFNEPAHMNTGHWKRIMKELTGIIRSEDKKHMIVWESADGWAQPHWCLWMEPVDDPNVLYSFHHYGKHWGYAYDEYYPSYQSHFERKQADVWLEAILFGIRHNVPIHCGEFGISMLQPGADGEAWLNDYLGMFERFGIGWNWWNYSGGNIYRTGLAARDRISPYVPILRKWMERSGWGATRRAKDGGKPSE